MDYTIERLTLSKLEKNYESLIETMENLKPTGEIDMTHLKNIFLEMEKSSMTFVAENKDGEIIGALKLLLEPKLIRGGVMAGKLEDVSVRKGYEGQKIGSNLIKKALEEAEKLGVYKITLSCRKFLVGFYEQFGFEDYSINMKKYFKK